MTQPPKGPGALTLLLRLSMLRARQQGAGSLAERGYSLAVALITSFVLLLGVAALASRGQLGFVGQVFQVQNRQARDVAEAAIAEFANTLNREPNRHLLIAGTTDNWVASKWIDNKGDPTDLDFRNICTAFNDDLTPVNNKSASYTPPQNLAITRFSTGQTRNLAEEDASRQFIIESIEFLNEDRQDYVDNDGDFVTDAGTSISYGQLFRQGRERSLIRITVLGLATQNGRTSRARVAREFEVVPKCCKRSFGQNVFGARNWGRDPDACGAQAGVPGILVGMGGGSILGSNAPKPGIVQEDGSTISTASCWNGNIPGDDSILDNDDINATCAAGEMNRGGISFVATAFSFDPPPYSHPSGLTPSSPTISPGASTFIYFDEEAFFTQGGKPATDTDRATKNAFSGISLRNGSTIRRLDGTDLTASTTVDLPDPCYVDEMPGSKRPYYTVNCSVTSLNPSGSGMLYVDTSAAKINFFFEGNGTYAKWSGNDGLIRLHGDRGIASPEFRSDLEYDLINNQLTPSTCLSGTAADCAILWPPPGEVTQATRLNTFLELCVDRNNYNCKDSKNAEELYGVRSLLNFYALGSGDFRATGNTSIIGFNIYAPNATVTIGGTGNKDNISFVGQIWTNDLVLNGGPNISIKTFSGGGGNATSGGTKAFAFGKPLIDFMARSFTQSSGFGL